MIAMTRLRRGSSRTPASLAPGPVDVGAIRGHFEFSAVGRVVTNAGRDAVAVAEALNRAGVESRADCHCATLAHHAIGLNLPASCRLSFYLYNTPGEVDRAVAIVAAVAAGRHVRGALVPIVPLAIGSEVRQLPTSHPARPGRPGIPSIRVRPVPSLAG